MSTEGFDFEKFVCEKYLETYSVNAITRMIYDMGHRTTDALVKKVLKEKGIPLRPRAFLGGKKYERPFGRFKSWR